MLSSHTFSPILDDEFLIENYETPDYLLEIFGDFLDVMPEEVEIIKAAQIKNDKETFLRKIHTVGSTVGFVGALNLSNQVKRFEVNIKTNPSYDLNSPETTQIINQVVELVDIIQDEVEQLSAY